MDGLDAVDTMIDDVVDDAVDQVDDISVDTDVSAESATDSNVDDQSTDQTDPSNPYTTKFSREMRTALKQWEQANPEAAKFAKQARDNHARLFALTQLEPKGIDGVREKYALLDSLAHGEAKGPEALTAMREELAGIQQIDAKVAAGDPTALDSFGPDFNAGLAKLAPAILDRILSSDPEAHESIMLPQHVKFLAGSQFVKDYNDIIDVLNTQGDPRFDDATKMKFAIQKLASMGQFMNGLQQKAGTLKAAPAAQVGKPDPLVERQTNLDKQEQDFHWNTKIAPQASTHEGKTFDSLFEPYQKRLRLDAAGKTALLQDFKEGLNRAGKADADYQRQMKLYKSQKNPDPAAVANFVKNAINKHSKPVMEALVKARYGAFLAGKPKPAVAAAPKPGAKAAGPVALNVEIRTVKPPMSEIDHRNTPVAWLPMKQYKLMNGKVIRVVAQ